MISKSSVSKAAEIQLTNIKGALQLYYLDVGQYPSETDGLSGLLTQPTAINDWNGPYIDDADDIQDPWGRPFRYTFPTENGSFSAQTQPKNAPKRRKTATRRPKSAQPWTKGRPS